MKGVKRPSTPIVAIVRILGIGLVAAAVVKELRTPKPERQWHGHLAGFVPYDFRLPTLDRLRASVWDPDSSQVLTPQVFGVGWALNLGRLFRRRRPQEIE